MAKSTKKLFLAILVAIMAVVMAFAVMSLSACGEDDSGSTDNTGDTTGDTSGDITGDNTGDNTDGTSGGTSDDTPVTYTYTVEIIGSDVSDGAAAIKTGSTTTLAAVVYENGVADSTLAEDVIWSTSASSVATVSGGVVTAVSAGTANITATYGTVSAKVTITVTDIVYTVKITGDDLVDGALSFDITDGDFTGSALKATVYADGEETTLAAEWLVSDTSIVSCTGGTVIPVSAGTTTVTAYYGTGTATVNVTVTKTEEEETGIVTLSGAGTLGGSDVTVYLVLDLENNTAKLYETMTTMGMEFTIVTPVTGEAYGTSLSGSTFGYEMVIPEGTITANVDATSGEPDGTYTVTFTYLTLPITFTVSVSEGVYTTSLVSLVSWGLLDCETAVSTSDSATTLAATGTLGGAEVSVYIVLDLTNNTAKLYEVMTASGIDFTIVSSSSEDLYGESWSGYDMGMGMAIGEGTITANVDATSGEPDGTYTVSFYYGYITFTVSVSEGVYSTSLASLVSLGLLDTVTISGEAEEEVVTISAASTLGGTDVNIYLELNLTDNTAKLYETMTTMGMEFTIVSADSTDVYGTTLSGYSYGMGMAVGEGAITANTDGTYTVSFYSGLIEFTVNVSEGVYTTSLAPLVAFGLVDSVTATSTTDSATTLVGTGTLGGADVSVYIVLDLTNNTAKLYEVMTASGIDFTIVSSSSEDLYGESWSGYDMGMGMAIGEGTITANVDATSGEPDGTYTVSFYYGYITFTVSVSEGTYSTSLASLVSLGLLDTVTATSEVTDTTTDTTTDTATAE